ncbi:MAG TPA: MEKHLA domain-containing protein, partial [Candidatus Methanoperedenaceae archaeon]|nr:MEKHLA domain-containing protein [Candidatus Methanoperedenaceae archaeon]
MSPPLDSPELIQHVQRMLKSYSRWTGRELIPASTPPGDSPIVLYQQPFVVLSHGTQDDPILNFGNRAALELWEMSWDEFTV